MSGFETILGSGMLRQASVGIRISGYFSGYFFEMLGSVRRPARVVRSRPIRITRIGMRI